MRERPVDEHADVVLAAVGQDLRLDPATEQVVGRLQGLHRRVSANSAICAASKFETPTWRILPVVDELLERSGGLRERDLRVGPVHLVEVDVVDFERAQASSTPLRSHSGLESRTRPSSVIRRPPLVAITTSSRRLSRSSRSALPSTRSEAPKP